MAAQSTYVIQASDIATYIIKVDNEETEKKLQVTSIVAETGINKIPRATIIIKDGDVSKGEFTISDSKAFDPGKKIEIQLGYQKPKSKELEIKTVFKGLIIKNTPKIGENSSELELECKHEAEKMTFTKSNSHFEGNTDSEIINTIVSNSKYQLEAEIEASDVKQGQLMQMDKTDWDFIISRMDASNMICTFPEFKVKVNKTPEEKDQDASEFPILTYGKTILEFNGDVDARLVTPVIGRAWDFVNQKVIEIKSDNGASPTAGASGTDQGGQQQVNNGGEAITASPGTSEESLQMIVNAKNLRQILSVKKGKVKYLGNTHIKPAQYIKLEGVGDKFNGNIFVSNIQHEFTDGCWFTEATLGWDEKFFAEQTNPSHAASASAQSSSIQGLHIGIVTNIEDKNGEYRVQVKLPTVSTAQEGIYARVSTLDAGNKRGTFFRPEVDDEVVLGFMTDDPAVPVILGMLHSSAKPSPFEPEKKNNEKGYVSRSEIKLVFNDENKSVIIKTPGERQIEMNDNDKLISLKDSFGNEITMGEAGIKISSYKDLVIEAKAKFSVEGTTEGSIKANTNLSVESTGPVTIKGANTEIKGTPIKLN